MMNRPNMSWVANIPSCITFNINDENATQWMLERDPENQII